MTLKGAGESLFRAGFQVGAQSRYRGPPPSGSITTWLLIALLSVLLVAFTTILIAGRYTRSIAVTGEISAAKGVVAISTPRSATVDQVFVAEGDEISKGAPLLRLKSSPLDDAGHTLEQTLDVDFNAENSSLQRQRLAEWDAQADKLRETRARIDGLVSQSRKLNDEVALETSRLTLQQSELDTLAGLVTKGFVSKVQANQLREDVLSTQTSIAALESQRVDLEAQEQSAGAQLRQLQAEARGATAATESALAQVSEKMANARAEAGELIASPSAGRVLAVNVKPGANVSDLTPLVILLPKGAKLQAELWVPSKSVGFLTRGDKVRLMYDAFPYERFGLGHGRVLGVARAPFVGREVPPQIANDDSVYRAQVALDSQAVFAFNRSWALVPGMRIHATIEAERRSLFQWLVLPLAAHLHRAQ